jgi:hypothetical protein
MPRTPKPKPDDPAQSKRFIETAREIGASDNAKDADEVFRRITGEPLKGVPKDGS